MKLKKETLREWLADGRITGATHTILALDTQTGDSYYPVHVPPGQDVKEEATKRNGVNQQRLIGVYAHHLDHEVQMSASENFSVFNMGYPDKNSVPVAEVSDPTAQPLCPRCFKPYDGERIAPLLASYVHYTDIQITLYQRALMRKKTPKTELNYLRETVHGMLGMLKTSGFTKAMAEKLGAPGVANYIDDPSLLEQRQDMVA